MEDPQKFKFFDYIRDYSINKDIKGMRNEWEQLCRFFSYEYLNDDIKLYDKSESGSDKNIIEKYKLTDFQFNQCLCGQYIVEHCIIKNKINGTCLCVGNSCINFFGDKQAKLNNSLFNGLKKLRDDKKLAKPTKKLIIECRKDKLLNDEEFEFLSQIKNVRWKDKILLNLEQLEKLLKINQKIINYYHNNFKVNYNFDHLKKLINGQKNNDLICDYYVKYIKNNPSNENEIYELQKCENPQWILTHLRLKCSYCEENNLYNINSIKCEGPNIDKCENCIEYRDIFIIRRENDNICECCYKDKFNPSGDLKKYTLICKNNILYWQLNEMKIERECRKCKLKFWVNIKESQTVCKDCFSARCAKCKKSLDYNNNKFQLFEFENKAFEICKSCMTAKEYIKNWLYKINYICNYCHGWNFRYQNEPKIRREKCWKC